MSDEMRRRIAAKAAEAAQDQARLEEVKGAAYVALADLEQEILRIMGSVPEAQHLPDPVVTIDSWGWPNIGLILIPTSYYPNSDGTWRAGSRNVTREQVIEEYKDELAKWAAITYPAQIEAHRNSEEARRRRNKQDGPSEATIVTVMVLILIAVLAYGLPALLDSMR